MTPGAKADALVRIEAERQYWRDLVAEVGEDRMEEPGPMGEWSFKDLASHLLAWRQRTIARLEAAAAGQSEPAPAWPADLTEDDEINEWFRERDKGKDVREVLDDVDRSYERIERAISALSDDVVTDRDAFRWLGGESLAEASLFSHLHEEHEPAIRTWLTTRSRARPAGPSLDSGT
jgi:hypothetical protein